MEDTTAWKESLIQYPEKLLLFPVLFHPKNKYKSSFRIPVAKSFVANLHSQQPVITAKTSRPVIPTKKIEKNQTRNNTSSPSTVLLKKKDKKNKKSAPPIKSKATDRRINKPLPTQPVTQTNNKPRSISKKLSKEPIKKQGSINKVTTPVSNKTKIRSKAAKVSKTASKPIESKQPQTSRPSIQPKKKLEKPAKETTQTSTASTNSQTKAKEPQPSKPSIQPKKNIEKPEAKTTPTRANSPIEKEEPQKTPVKSNKPKNRFIFTDENDSVDIDASVQPKGSSPERRRDRTSAIKTGDSKKRNAIVGLVALAVTLGAIIVWLLIKGSGQTTENTSGTFTISNSEQADKERKAVREKAEKDKITKEKKAAKDKAKKEKIAQDKKDAEEKAKRERIAREKKAAEEKAEKERIAREKKAAKDEANRERRAKEKKAAKDKAEKDKAEKDKAEKDKAEKDKAEKERIARERKDEKNKKPKGYQKPSRTIKSCRSNDLRCQSQEATAPSY